MKKCTFFLTIVCLMLIFLILLTSCAFVQKENGEANTDPTDSTPTDGATSSTENSTDTPTLNYPNYSFNGTTPKEGELAFGGKYRMLYEKDADAYAVTEYLGKEIDIVIPDTYLGEDVFKIANGAFSHVQCDRITIPKSVRIIDDYAFSVSACGCMDIHGCSVKQIVFEEDSRLESIGTGAFYNCVELELIDIPQSVVEIGPSAFCSCDGLKEIVLPQNITKLSRNVFDDCINLEKITIPNDVDEIGKFSFFGCRSLKKVDIPEKVVSIGEAAFWGCTSLTEINIPTAVESIGEFAFLYCGAVDRISVGKENEFFSDDGNCLIDKATKTIIRGSNNSIIPDDGSVVAIGTLAFSYAAGLKEIDLPSCVEEIASDAFFGCTGIEKITVEEGHAKFHSTENCLIETAEKRLKMIANGASIPTDESVTVIGSNAFRGWSGAKELTVPENITVIEGSSFNFATELERITLPETLSEIGGSAFYGCTDLKEIVIPDGITEIEGSMFAKCEKLESVIIPSSVKSIDSNAFGKCSSLKSITLPKGIKTILRYTFRDCISLESIDFPEGVEKIEREAFYGCTSLKSITLPETVIEIETEAFRDCDSLEKIVVDDKNQKYYDVDNSLIEAETQKLILGATTGVIPNDGSIKEIGDYAFTGRLKSNTVTVPKGVTRIGQSAFSGCKELEHIDLPASVRTIGSGAFAGCRSLRSIEIPSRVTKITQSCFANSGLESISIPKVLTIDYFAFHGCENLKSVELSTNLNTMEGSAFGGFGTPTIEISYNGTEADWNSFEKTSKNWLANLSRAVIKCLDGVIERSRND